jgi:hypothetical protein
MRNATVRALGEKYAEGPQIYGSVAFKERLGVDVPKWRVLAGKPVNNNRELHQA